MFNANVKVMFKVNGYEFKVRNTSETTKQVSLHDRDGSLLCSYPLHDYSTDNFDYSGITSCLIEFNRFCNKLNVLTIERNGLKLVARIQQHKNQYRLDVSDLNFAGRFLKYYSGSYNLVTDRLIENMHSYLGMNREYTERVLNRMKVLEYKGKVANW